MLHSEPVQLGSTTVDGNGKFQTAVVIPLNTDLGHHTLEVVGVGCGVTTSVPLTVVAAPASDVESAGGMAQIAYRDGGPMSLSYTGVNTTQAVMIGTGLFGVGALISLAARRRPAIGRHRH